MTGCGATAAVVVGWLPACAGHQQAATDAVTATGHPAAVTTVYTPIPCRAGSTYPDGPRR